MTESSGPTTTTISSQVDEKLDNNLEEFMHDFVDFVPLFEDEDEAGAELNQLVGDCFGRRRDPNQRRIDFRSHLSDLFLESCEETDSRFDQLKIQSGQILDQVDERYICDLCHKSRRFFCYSCLSLSPQLASVLPLVRLPVKVDIVKHSKEVEGKSTCPHAAVLAPEDVRIFIYPELPDDWPQDPNRILLLFPRRDSPTVAQYLSQHYHLDQKVDDLPGLNALGQDAMPMEADSNWYHRQCARLPPFPFERVVFIDSTWRQTKSILKDERIKRLPAVMIESEHTLFWRYHKRRPMNFLSTIEAIYYFLRQLHTFMADYLDRMDPAGLHSTTTAIDSCDFGQLRRQFPRYEGQYDNLLFFFRHTYQTIKSHYRL